MSILSSYDNLKASTETNVSIVNIFALYYLAFLISASFTYPISISTIFKGISNFLKYLINLKITILFFPTKLREFL
jgi:hypothetical protein